MVDPQAYRPRGARFVALVLACVAVLASTRPASAYVCPHVASESVTITVPVTLPVTRAAAAHAAHQAASVLCTLASAETSDACLYTAQRRAEAAIQSAAASAVSSGDVAVPVSLRVNYTTSVELLGGAVSVRLGPTDVASDVLARVCATHGLGVEQCAAASPAIRQGVLEHHLGHLRRCKERLDAAGLLNAPVNPTIADIAAEVAAASAAAAADEVAVGSESDTDSGATVATPRGDCIDMAGSEAGDVALRQQGAEGSDASLAAKRFSLYLSVDSNLCVWMEVRAASVYVGAVPAPVMLLRATGMRRSTHAG